MNARLSVVILLLLGIVHGTAAAQASRQSPSGLFVGGSLIAGPGFDMRFIPGSYPALGLTRQITAANADIGSVTFSGGIRGFGGWGFSRFLALQAGFDFLGGKFESGGRSDASSAQGSIFTGVRLQAPTGGVTPYAFGNVGAMSVTTSSDAPPNVSCGPNTQCIYVGDEWNGTVLGFGGGLELGAKPAGAGHWVLDMHVESISASLDCDAGANEKCEKPGILRFSIGAAWRYSRIR